MKPTGWVLLLAVLAWVPLGGPLAWGEQPSPELRLELKLARKPRGVEQPAPDPRIAEEDTEKALAEIQVRERTEELVRETLRLPSRRPDLSYDVWSGIQARNTTPALRRR
jgi:hypothetical protein